MYFLYFVSSDFLYFVYEPSVGMEHLTKLWCQLLKNNVICSILVGDLLFIYLSIYFFILTIWAIIPCCFGNSSFQSVLSINSVILNTLEKKKER